MSKIIIIDTCYSCPNFKTYLDIVSFPRTSPPTVKLMGRCKELDIIVKKRMAQDPTVIGIPPLTDSSTFPQIPNDCPLENYK